LVVEIQKRLPDSLNIAVSQKCIAHEDHKGEGFQPKLFLNFSVMLHPDIGKENENNV
jgi:hypothetical protein